MVDSMPRAPDAARRRNALEVGLQSVLTATQVYVALRLWDGSYAASRPMALAEYVNELAALLGYSVTDRHALRVAIYSAIAKHDVRPGAPVRPVPAPPPVPAAPAPSVGVRAPAPVRPDAPAFVVFSCVADEIAAGLRREAADEIEEFAGTLSQQAGSIGLGAQPAQMLGRWARQAGDLRFFAEWPGARLSAILHAIYAAAAQAAGPIIADRLLARAVQVAEARPEAVAFSPRKLL